jgi:hypothetical protein
MNTKGQESALAESKLSTPNGGCRLVEVTDLTARVADSHCYPYHTDSSSRTNQNDMDCGGRAQRRHRFVKETRPLPKAAWCFASRRSPKARDCGFATLGGFVSSRGGTAFLLERP